ncbi:glycine betaine ABC transporter substrate-binding protein [Bacteriovoracaceae bacterium]|nr:glycine betaine ABC transporter substrate-binding protein [Bacteriovoracaceae bacterium]
MKVLIFFILFHSMSVFANDANNKEPKDTMVIGSKNFTESYILAEILAKIATQVGEAKVIRKFGMGGTGICYQSLENEAIDIYPEYTGTISEVILKKPSLKSWNEIQKELFKDGYDISSEIGFNNTYALATRLSYATEKQIKKISQLKNMKSFRMGFTHEFLKREDGYQQLKKHYQFGEHDTLGIEHSLAYEALNSEKIDFMEVYSTDAKISKFGLRVLEDDLNFFPNYKAILFYKKSFSNRFPKTYKAFNQYLIGKISNEQMIKLNSLVEVDQKSFSDAAFAFLGEGFSKSKKVKNLELKRILTLSIEHMKLVSVSLIFAVLLAVPVGIFAFHHRGFGQVLLGMTAIMQTIPSLALLCFLIPFLGIGNPPAYFALFLYGLLPIARNTYLGFSSIPTKLIETCELMGMSSWQRLCYVEFPLAFKSILSGVQTSAVINVGTATLAAFIGAGGLGTLINTGLALNNTKIILTGAIPAAFLAILVHVFFEVIEKRNFFRKDH